MTVNAAPWDFLLLDVCFNTTVATHMLSAQSDYTSEDSLAAKLTTTKGFQWYTGR